MKQLHVCGSSIFAGMTEESVTGCQSMGFGPSLAETLDRYDVYLFFVILTADTITVS